MELKSRTHTFSVTRGHDLRCDLEMLAPYFGANCEMELVPNETAELADSLLKMHEDGAGHVDWRSKDGSLRLVFVMSKKQELHVTVQVTAEPDYVDELTCLVETHQSELPRLAAELRQLSAPE